MFDDWVYRHLAYNVSETVAVRGFHYDSARESTTMGQTLMQRRKVMKGGDTEDGQSMSWTLCKRREPGSNSIVSDARHRLIQLIVQIR